MGLYVVGFYGTYIVVFATIILIAGLRYRSLKAVGFFLVIGMLIPLSDYYYPRVKLHYFCKDNLSFISKVPIQNVKGFYYENDNFPSGGGNTCVGKCDGYIFGKGYDFIEGKLDKKIIRNPTPWHFSYHIHDKHESLYRFTLLSYELGQRRYTCEKPNISLEQKVYKGTKIDVTKTKYLCVFPLKLKKITAPYLYIEKVRFRGDFSYGRLTEFRTTIKNNNGDTLLFSNSFSLIPRSFLGVNTLFRAGCSSRNKIKGRLQVQDTLIPPNRSK